MTKKEKSLDLIKGDLVLICSNYKVNSLQIIVDKDQRYSNYVIGMDKNQMPNFEEIIQLDEPEIGLVLESHNIIFYYGSYFKVFLPSREKIVFARNSQIIKINSIFNIIINKNKTP